MDSEMLAQMLGFIQGRQFDIHSITIIRNGYLVLDASIYPYTENSLHAIKSCTKSITSALIGIAIEQGYIESVEQSVWDFFPARRPANLDADKEAMTIEHLLLMASGLKCRDSYLYRWRGLERMMQTEDWVEFMLNLPMAEPPGTRFEYCNGASFLLAAIIQEATGVSAAAYAEAHLFAPMGISDVVWPANPQGITIGWGEMLMEPHDMAKFGYLYLNEGVWDGAQIVPADWVAASTREQITATGQNGYGYQWWIAEEGFYSAQGYAGQFIFVVPEYDLVVVFTSNLPERAFNRPQNLLNTFIIPAAVSSTPLPANPDGAARLETKLQQAAQNQAEPTPVTPAPEIAQRVSGQTYALAPNPLGWLSFTLTFQEETEALFSWIGGSDGDDPQDWQEGNWPVGLDNIYRLTPGENGLLMGLKGGWDAEETFVVDGDYIGNTGRFQLRFSFVDEFAAIQVWENGRLFLEITGRQE